MDSLKCRWKRLNRNGNKWVAACRAANARKRSGMSDQDDGSNSKRTKTSESGEYTIPSNPETPTSGHSTSSRSIGKDKAKRIGKGKVTQSDSINAQCAADLHALRLAKDNENEIARARLQLERVKLDKPSMKMYQKMLLKLLEKEHLSPKDQDMKRNLTKIVFGK
ncbi:hypothetical protein SASPL_130625 [Salvia splendens]|uniref:No apical meristem-associated C-terminal domain-containing protein n=1 Tax=Salvia splendens TaxID=180675 RepID=A0A8X8X7L0_SALSN|nr:hypothetical protein SASPL_130625 [Salvia splendens]